MWTQELSWSGVWPWELEKEELVRSLVLGASGKGVPMGSGGGQGPGSKARAQEEGRVWGQMAQSPGRACVSRARKPRGW